MSEALGLSMERELLQLRRPLPVKETWDLDVRAFVVGQDEAAWLAVNNRAFEGHVEQGGWTDETLAQRQSEAWFDPSGFVVIDDRTDVDPDGNARMAAFHWTKVEAGQTGGPVAGEVYVVGVDPDYQGRGLGRAVTLLGLQHLRNVGVETATLYVDGDNAAAIATYGRIGFERSAIDVMYAAGAAGS